MYQVFSRSCASLFFAIFLLAPANAIAAEGQSAVRSDGFSVALLSESVGTIDKETNEAATHLAAEGKLQCFDTRCGGAQSDFECNLVCGENHFDSSSCACVSVGG